VVDRSQTINGDDQRTGTQRPGHVNHVPLPRQRREQAPHSFDQQVLRATAVALDPRYERVKIDGDAGSIAGQGRRHLLGQPKHGVRRLRLARRSGEKHSVFTISRSTSAPGFDRLQGDHPSAGTAQCQRESAGHPRLPYTRIRSSDEYPHVRRLQVSGLGRKCWMCHLILT
jgi:hypothetical protein